MREEKNAEIVLDTETTGLSTKDGHKIIEIGCVKLIDRKEIEDVFHVYINPKRPVSISAFAIHKISDQFLSDKPVFSAIVEDFLKFIGKSKLIIHNASFDIRFLNHELSILGLPLIEMSRAVDTLAIARRKFPGAQATLDALCKRFDISLHSREFGHGALVDARLLAAVYSEMMKSDQANLLLQKPSYHIKKNNFKENKFLKLQNRKFTFSSDEMEAHLDMLAKIDKPIWKNKGSS
ncbi:MAG: DNA polymerase III subunit epsilon [Proteobacteria bacterium]|nr:DNA polymerase III subunit epsilon [Pseudomonadota bacterium]